MRTLAVVLQQLASPVPGGIGRYAANLTQALVPITPADWRVRGVTARRSDDEPPLLRETAAALRPQDRLDALPLERRVLAEAWRRGVATGGALRGADALYAPSLLAPLPGGPARRRPRTLVTVHDTVPWTHPETLTPRGVRWHRDLAERAAALADVVAVPTAAVGWALRGFLDLRGELLVVPGAPSPSLRLPDVEEAQRIAERLALPARFVLAVGTLEPRKGLAALVRAFADDRLDGETLVIAGPEGWGGVQVADLVADAGIPAERVRTLGFVSDEELAVLYDRAGVFVMPSLDEGFGLPVVEAMSFGCPVVHTDVPALVEVAGGRSVVVPLADGTGARPEDLAAAIAPVLDDETLRAELGAGGRDRAGVTSWAASATLVRDALLR